MEKLTTMLIREDKLHFHSGSGPEKKQLLGNLNLNNVDLSF